MNNKNKVYKAILNKIFDALTEEEKDKLMMLVKQFLKDSLEEKKKLLDYIA